MVVGVLLTALAVVKILSERRTPQSMAAWLLLMLTVPWVGLPLYLLFGGRKMQSLKEGKEEVQLSHVAALPSTESPIERALHSLGIPPATKGNAIEFEFDGVHAFHAATGVIESARDRIDYATFIFAEDDVGREMLDRLAAKAKAGCHVRLLLDGFGCVKTRRRFFTPLIDAGGQVAYFSPVLHRPFYGRTNLRNHRKIIIADDRRVWSGGRNTADEYLGPTPRPDRWLDLSFTVQGPAVEAFTEIFEADWAFATEQKPVKRLVDLPALPRNQIVQAVPSGPDIPQDVLLAAILTATYRAERRIRMVTPYFVPPDSVTQSLVFALHRGVEVELLLPDISNHRLTDWAREPHLGDIHEAGGRILLLPRMNHAKAAVFDDELAFAGSANIDERSLLLNYEVMTALYGHADVHPLTEWIDQLAASCRRWQPTGGRIRRMCNGLAELAAPLM
jgi:cardiolipin synthase